MPAIEIVDCGRGLQLSTSRITVQDLVPYFQRGYSHEEILRLMPALSRDELVVVDDYYRKHQAELDDEDCRIRAHIAEQIRLQRLKFPVEPREVRLARMKETLRQRQKNQNGQRRPG
ncbi:MAG TPA: DUF433 domain-containing protein [Gemmataceae bacterium]|nr:DUF433 domain-containing protein [Gemmataceae bacterium]